MDWLIHLPAAAVTDPSDDRSLLATAYEWAWRIIIVSLEMVLPGLAGYWVDHATLDCLFVFGDRADGRKRCRDSALNSDGSARDSDQVINFDRWPRLKSNVAIVPQPFNIRGLKVARARFIAYIRGADQPWRETLLASNSHTVQFGSGLAVVH